MNKTIIKFLFHNSIYFKIIKWLIIVIIFVVLIIYFTNPLRGKSAQNFISSGDIFLADKKYLSANLEYQKALILNPRNPAALDRKNLIELAESNVLELEGFLKANQFTEELKKIDEANSFPEDETEAVKLSKKLIKEQEYQLAIIPAKVAIQMDRNYRDGWLYLGIANLKTAQFVELTPKVRSQYVEESKNVLKEALTLDPEYESTKKFLQEAEIIN